MKDSTKRALRTFVQALIGVALAVPLAVAEFGARLGPLVKYGAVAVGVAGVVTKAWNMAEEGGLVPGWLKAAPTPTVAPALPVPVPAAPPVPAPPA